MNQPSETGSLSLRAALQSPAAYPRAIDQEIVCHETHVSWVFLAGTYAYKIKKPIQTHFLDYSTAERRHRFCDEELRLDSRYAPDLYLGVVPICRGPDRYAVEGAGEAVEWAVKMRRFPAGSLLSERLQSSLLTLAEVKQLAATVSLFHQDAAVARRDVAWGSPHSVLVDALDNVTDLRSSSLGDSLQPELHRMKEWTRQFFDQHQVAFSQRRVGGFVRECHGDLHAANIVQWNDRFVPFDGIEFNDAFRWIDVLSDAAFLGMDLHQRGRPDFSHSFLDTYLESTGDHASLAILRWYLIYRAMVRAKVASIVCDQHAEGTYARRHAIEDCRNHLAYATRLTRPPTPTLWITHGFSGSGKTTGSEVTIQRHGAFRLRSDVERKRHFGLHPEQHPGDLMKQKIYNESANRATYSRLERLARGILRSGFSVVIDATFVKHSTREQFAKLARRESARYRILDFQADKSVLRERIKNRHEDGQDASDADLSVLDSQIRSSEPLTDWEREQVDAGDPTDAGDPLNTEVGWNTNPEDQR